MGTGVSGFSTHRHFEELDEAIWSDTGWLSPEARKTLARANLGITADVDALNTVTEPVIALAAGGAVSLDPAGGVVAMVAATANPTVALGEPTLGKHYRFIYMGGATDAEDWVITATGVLFVGNIAWLTHGTPDIEPVYANGSNHNTLTVNNPAAGTWVEVIGDGTNWMVTGQAVAANTPAFSAV